MVDLANKLAALQSPQAYRGVRDRMIIQARQTGNNQINAAVALAAGDPDTYRQDLDRADEYEAELTRIGATVGISC
jgi:hypothetical protein